MIVNDKPGKSALLPSLVGRGAVTSKRTLSRYDTLPVGDKHLAVVSQYTHVGGVMASNSRIDREVKNRSSSLACVTAPLRSAVVAKSSLPLPQVVAFVDSLAISSLLFNAHTWTELTPVLASKLESKIFALIAAPSEIALSSRIRLSNGSLT